MADRNKEITLNKYNWQLLPSKPLERSSHTINYINNKLYLFGGEHEPRIPIDNEVHVYDITSAKWSIAESTSASDQKPCPRIAHSSSVIGDKIYVYAGRVGVSMGEASLNDLYVFDTKTNTWTKLDDGEDDKQSVRPEKRSYHAMCAHKDKLYVFGGCSANHGRLNDLFEYDTKANKWTRLNSDEKIAGRGGSLLCNDPEADFLYVIAGFCGEELNDMYKFDIAANGWTRIADLPRKLSVFACSTVESSKLKVNGHNVKLILHGGEIDPSTIGHNGAGEFSNDTYIFDGTNWHMLDNSSPLKPTSRGWHAACFSSADDTFYIFGGLLENVLRNNELWSLNF